MLSKIYTILYLAVFLRVTCHPLCIWLICSFLIAPEFEPNFLLPFPSSLSSTAMSRGEEVGAGGERGVAGGERIAGEGRRGDDDGDAAEAEVE